VFPSFGFCIEVRSGPFLLDCLVSPQGRLSSLNEDPPSGPVKLIFWQLRAFFTVPGPVVNCRSKRPGLKNLRFIAVEPPTPSDLEAPFLVKKSFSPSLIPPPIGLIFPPSRDAYDHRWNFCWTCRRPGLFSSDWWVEVAKTCLASLAPLVSHPVSLSLATSTRG